MLSFSDIFKQNSEEVESRRKVIKSFKAKANEKKSHSENFADLMTSKFGKISFVVVNIIWFIVWLVINSGMIESIKPFDPYPFVFLTTLVSLEAIVLTVIVLISQNREAKIAELREEIDLRINTITESEVTKIIQLIALLVEKNGIKLDDDHELKKMLKKINNETLVKELERELSPNQTDEKGN